MSRTSLVNLSNGLRKRTLAFKAKAFVLSAETKRFVSRFWSPSLRVFTITKNFYGMQTFS